MVLQDTGTDNVLNEFIREIGGAGKGCSCSEIRAFELRTFGEVDEAALKSDFGC